MLRKIKTRSIKFTKKEITEILSELYQFISFGENSFEDGVLSLFTHNVEHLKGNVSPEDKYTCFSIMIRAGYLHYFGDENNIKGDTLQLTEKEIRLIREILLDSVEESTTLKKLK